MSFEIHPLLNASKNIDDNKLNLSLKDLDNVLILTNLQYRSVNVNNLNIIHELLEQNFNEDDFVIINFWSKSKGDVDFYYRYIQDKRFDNLCYIEGWFESKIEDNKEKERLFKLMNLPTKTSRKKVGYGYLIKFKNQSDFTAANFMNLQNRFKA